MVGSLWCLLPLSLLYTHAVENEKRFKKKKALGYLLDFFLFFAHVSTNARMNLKCPFFFFSRCYNATVFRLFLNRFVCAALVLFTFLLLANVI